MIFPSFFLINLMKSFQFKQKININIYMISVYNIFLQQNYWPKNYNVFLSDKDDTIKIPVMKQVHKLSNCSFFMCNLEFIDSSDRHLSVAYMPHDQKQQWAKTILKGICVLCLYFCGHRKDKLYMCSVVGWLQKYLVTRKFFFSISFASDLI